MIKKGLNPSVDNEKKEEIIESVKNGEYTNNRLESVIEKLNEGAKNRTVFGVDCIDELKKSNIIQ